MKSRKILSSLPVFAFIIQGFLSCSPERNPVSPISTLPPRDDSTFWFPVGTEGLNTALPGPIRNGSAGDTLELTASYVKKSINGRMERMLAYDGCIPGPNIRVRQGDTVFIRFRNRSGTTLSFTASGGSKKQRPVSGMGDSSAPVADGGDALYRLAFPEPGTYWYHDGLREDMSRALGLAGSIWVTPVDSLYWNPVDREVSMILGELKTDSNGIVPFRRESADHAVLGRFGTTYLINGDPNYELIVKRNEYVRFHVVSAFNSRVIFLVMNRHWMKVVASDIGKYEYSQLSAGEVLGPGERVSFEVKFREADSIQIYHQTPERYFQMGTVRVLEDSVDDSFGKAYFETDTNAAISQDIDRFRHLFSKTPDYEVLMTDKSRPAPAAKQSAARHGPGSIKGIVWGDTTGETNANSTIDKSSWIFRDLKSGAENEKINWTWNLGEPVVIRIMNDSTSTHPMPHPIEFPGQRFLVVNVDGVRNLALAWKDVYLVPVGSTVELVLDPVASGEWVARCRIAEHQHGMSLGFQVK